MDRASHLHTYADATKNEDYIQFDLWFKAVSERPIDELKLVINWETFDWNYSTTNPGVYVIDSFTLEKWGKFQNCQLLIINF